MCTIIIRLSVVHATVRALELHLKLNLYILCILESWYQFAFLDINFHQRLLHNCYYSLSFYFLIFIVVNSYCNSWSVLSDHCQVDQTTVSHCIVIKCPSINFDLLFLDLLV